MTKEQKYIKTHMEIDDKLSRLLAYISDMPADADMVTWPEIGNLGHLNEELTDLVKFMHV